MNDKETKNTEAEETPDIIERTPGVTIVSAEFFKKFPSLICKGGHVELKVQSARR